MSFYLQVPVNKSGYGVVGRGLLRGACGLGLDFRAVTIHGVEWDEAAGDNPNAVWPHLFSKPDPFAPTLKVWHHHSDLTAWEGRGKRALYTFFEVDRLPEGQVDELNRQTDEVWVASHWAAGVLRDSGYAHEVRALPAGVDPTVFNPDVPPAKVEGLGPDTFAFVTAGKWSLNKGHDVLLEAFNRAFRPDDDVALVAACFNGVRAPTFDGPAESAKWARWYRESELGRAGKMFAFDHHLPSQVDLAALFARANCGVFPYRAEGFCLELFEMTAMGKYCIATEASAPAEYLDDLGAFGIPPDGREAAWDPPFFFGDASWAHLGAGYVRRLAEQMRRAYEGGPLKNDWGPGNVWAWDRVAGAAAGYLGVCPPSTLTSPSAKAAKPASSPCSRPPASPADGATGGPTTSGSKSKTKD